MDSNTLIGDLKGIGPKTEGYYHKLGLNKAEDVLYYYPRDYIKYDRPQALSQDKVGEVCFFYAKILKQPLLRRAGKTSIVSATLICGEITVSAVWFHMPYLVKSLKAGSTYIFGGILQMRGNHYHVEQPQIFTEEKYRDLLESLQPVYPLTKGITNQALVKVVHQVLDNLNLNNYEITNDLLKDYDDFKDLTEQGISISEAFYNIHFPKNFESLLKAKKRLVFDEFFLFVLKLRMLKEDNSKALNSFNIYPTAYTKNLIDSLPYRLTGAQLKVWNEIENDLTGEKAMNRLVQGDVGSGKTIISVLAAITVCISGYQAAIMAPTEILATQHFESFSALLREHNIPLKCGLLTGSMTVSRKKEVYKQIESGEVNIIIGTHALIQEKVEYNNLALVITDEQHRFGVKQREKLKLKSQETPHILVMSATPIPRTLAIILYGDLDISIIDEVPARRLPIKNCVVNTSYRKSAYSFMEKEIDAGRQVYIICPLVEETEGLIAEDVISYTEKLREVFSNREDINIAYLHGKMKPAEKNNIMEAFYKNDIQILISTTVVEVGVNVPNATVMLIENAERFGLAQLHQLRGRIGRGDKQSYCIFMSSKKDEKTMDRLKILNNSNDGFYIASEDLKLRGPGDMFGIRQSGDMQFRLGDVFNDADMLKKASDAADLLLKDDPLLEKAEHSILKKYLDNNLEMVIEI